jgi:hypothetical protein
MDACYLDNAIVVTSLSSVSIRVSNSFILEQYLSYTKRSLGVVSN